MADEYLKVSGTEVAAGSTGVYQKYKDMTGYHALAVYLAEAISATFSGDLPDTEAGDLAAIAAALAGTLAISGTVTGNPTPRAASSGNMHEPAANTAAVVTKSAAGAGVSNVVGGVYWSYDGDPTGGSLTITDGGTQVFKVDITGKGPGFLPFDPPIKGAANAAVVATLAAGGDGVSGIVNLNAWTE